MILSQVLLRGTRADQPAASASNDAFLYFVTDEGVVEQSDGSSWLSYSGAGGGASPSLPRWTYNPSTISPQTFTTNNAAIVSTTRITLSITCVGGDNYVANFLQTIPVGSTIMLADASGRIWAFSITATAFISSSYLQLDLDNSGIQNGGDWDGDYAISFAPGETIDATARSAADSAQTAADTAQTAADGAQTAADGAQTTADTAVTAAGTAQTAADNAQTAADNAQSTADAKADPADITIENAETNSGITPFADGTYTVGLGVTVNGTITIAKGIITSVQEAS